MAWPLCLSERFISPPLREAFGILPRRADVDTVVTFLADQFVGDFDGMGKEFEMLSRGDRSDCSSLAPRPPLDIDTPFRLRVLYLLHSGARKQARMEVEARASRLRAGEEQGRSSTPARRARKKAARREQSVLDASSTVNSSAPSPLLAPNPSQSLSAAAFLPFSADNSSPSSKRKYANPPLKRSIKKIKREAIASPRPCTSCRALKVRCDRKDPCDRCERAGRKCVSQLLTKSGRRRQRQKASHRRGIWVDGVEEGPCEQLSVDSGSDSERSPSKPAKQSLPYGFKKKKKTGWSSSNISNRLLILLGRPPLPSLPKAESARKVAAKGQEKPLTVREGPKSSSAKRHAPPFESEVRNIAATASTTSEVLSSTPPTAGIPSRTFAAVMRLVAGLGPVRLSTPTSRPAPGRAPPVWAQSRQELCEALPYYRAFQSGMYMHKRVPFGYLLDGYPSPRDVWADDGRVIISHGGGQAVRVTDAMGKVSVSLAADHTRSDARIDTLILAAQRRAPVILLAGEGYALLPWKLGCAYAVLGWYWVSCTWYEAEPCADGVEAPEGRSWFHRLKIRFDWINTQGTPWWFTKGVPWVAPDEDMTQMEVSVSATVPTATLPANGCDVTTDHRNTSFQATEASHLPSTPVSCDENHPAVHEAPLPVKIPISQLILPLTPPPDSPTPSVETNHDGEAVRNAVWRRAPARNIGPSPFDDLYFSPLEIHRGKRYPGDHLLANFHPDPPPARPWLHAGQRCPSCLNYSPRLYREGWICLVAECIQFWLLSTTVGLIPISPSMKLRYDETFLRVIPTPYDAASLPYNIVPPPPSSSPQAEGTGEAGSRSLWRGFVCSCGRSNCRYRWERLSCRACGQHSAAQTDSDVVRASAIQSDKADPLGEADEGSPDIPMSVRRMLNPCATVIAYELPQAGTVYHVMHDHVEFADAIWEAYQRAAIHTSASTPLFQRRALKSNTIKGQLLSQQFAINSGASYKYIVETLSYPFADSPDCVMDALMVIRKRVAAVLGEAVDFNEILSVMYREGQKMSWHDDGEHVVAALSLGSPATMSFRPKASIKVHRGGGLALSGGVNPSQPASVLNLTLSHGDVVIMSGRAIQYGYDHRVIPSGLRVAATARVIRASPE
ncbi:unnamed protein product [Cutaneotrichosporon oleaginosum]